MTRSLFFALAAVAVAGCSSFQPVQRAEQPPLQAVESVDLARYRGLWHEQARLPNWFERGCVAATATYTERPDGLIGVRNVCTKADGGTEDAVGRARVVDAVSNAKLKVSFFGPFWGDYWVIDLAPDYSWVIVGEPSGRYLWVLTRAPAIDAGQKADFLARIAAKGYRTDRLIWNGA
ncbi:MAG: lipocalin family protein [Hyphomonadaceae bacterium]|nr:lipocalin family protein [Hyphomonadaceae bacterium]